MHLRCECSLLVPEEPEGGRSNTGTWVRIDGHEATRGTLEEGRTATETGVGTGQRALLACNKLQDEDEERSPADQLRVPNTCSHPGGEGGGEPLTWKRVHMAHIQGAEVGPPTLQHAPQARVHKREEEGGPPTQQRT